MSPTSLYISHWSPSILPVSAVSLASKQTRANMGHNWCPPSLPHNRELVANRHSFATSNTHARAAAQREMCNFPRSTTSFLIFRITLHFIFCHRARYYHVNQPLGMYAHTSVKSDPSCTSTTTSCFKIIDVHYLHRCESLVTFQSARVYRLRPCCTLQSRPMIPPHPVLLRSDLVQRGMATGWLCRLWTIQAQSL